MSIFGPNQVEELIIGNAVAVQTTVSDFIDNAADGEIKVLSNKGGAAVLGEAFRLYQKSNGNAPLNYEFSDVIIPSKVENVIVKAHAPEVQKSATFTITQADPNTTYSVELRLYNDGGSLSPENFVTISGYYVTSSVVPAITEIRDGIIESLSNNLERRGNFEFVVAANGTDAIDITGALQNVVPGKIIGKQIEFDVNGKSFPNVTLLHENTGLVTFDVTAQNNPGCGTGKYAVNLEWFTKGYKYEVYRVLVTLQILEKEHLFMLTRIQLIM